MSTARTLQSFCKGVICYMGAELTHSYHFLTPHQLHHNRVGLGIKFQSQFWRANHNSHLLHLSFPVSTFEEWGNTVSYFRKLWAFKTKDLCKA